MLGVWATEEDAKRHAASRSGLIYFEGGPARWCVDYAPTAHGVETVAQVVDIKLRHADRGARPANRMNHHRAQVIA